jgi:hypothetical protein
MERAVSGPPLLLLLLLRMQVLLVRCQLDFHNQC